MLEAYKSCNLCQRKCNVDRTVRFGYCGMGPEPYVARIGLHHWEEPIISGKAGSGTIFFSGCSLRCIFCQNNEISKTQCGRKMTDGELADAMLDLSFAGAHNINFVTPTHFAHNVVESVRIARAKGLEIPIVYNTSSYDTEETIKMLSETVDVFLPDFKYFLPKTAKMYSKAEDYIVSAKKSIEEMVKNSPTPIIEDGLMKKGVIVRILLLPSHVAEAKLSLEYIYKTYGDDVYISLMSQYTPMPNMPKPLDRKVSIAEYTDLVNYADKLGVKNAFIQDFSSAATEYIPIFNSFDLEDNQNE